MIPRAHVEHHMQGRTRIRLDPGLRDPGYYSSLCDQLKTMEGVDSVEANPKTGGILVLHRLEQAAERIAKWAGQHGLFELIVEEPPPVPVSDRISRRIHGLDQRMTRVSQGNMDLRAAIFFGLVAAGVVQLFRGPVLPAAGALLINAFQMLPKFEELSTGDKASGPL